jgi:hypothetical protein
MVIGLWSEEKILPTKRRHALRPNFLSLESVMTTAFSPRQKRTDWRPLYRAAILETDKKVLPQRVSVAEAAVIARRLEIFYADGTAEEKEDLEDALYALHALHTALQHSDAA